VLCGVGTEARAQYSRRTPIVEAVQKTRGSIVTIKVEKRGNWGRKETVGTGVIVDERGYALTNCHVIAGAERVAAVLFDGTELQAQVLTEDGQHDLAILRLPSKPRYQALAFGPGSDLMVGETVLVVGHPLGYTNSVSTGIISALDREIPMPRGEVLTKVIQTSASINPGNSGGPLLNINGELIGIVVALREGAQGIAFAINADTAQQVVSHHLSAARMGGVAHGLVCRVKVEPEGKVHQRVVVEQVAQSSPAARAGLKDGDVLLKLAHRPVSNCFDVERAFWGLHDGDTIEADVVRDGKVVTVAMTLASETTGSQAATSWPSKRTRTATDEETAQPVKNRK
jgi:serine protease Do